MMSNFWGKFGGTTKMKKRTIWYHGDEINRCPNCDQFPSGIFKSVKCHCGLSTRTFHTGETQSEISSAISAWNRGEFNNPEIMESKQC